MMGINVAEGRKGHWVQTPNEEVLKTHPHLKDFLPFLDVINGESPRGGVLVAAAFLEHLLHQVLESFLIQGKPQERLLTGFNAPIGTFSAKIALAAALGLISEQEHRECELIRKIRNKFAHHVHPTFENKDIKSLCFELTFRAMPHGDVTVDARGSFTTAATGLASNLTNRAHYVSKVRLAPRDWPI